MKLVRKLRRMAVKHRLFILVYALIAVALALGIRAFPGNPDVNALNSPAWRESGPFELSPERGRYALLYSIAEYRSVFFPPELAKFTLPDVGYTGGRYVSLFAPGVSLLALPGYLLGRMFNLAQLGAFAVTAVAAFFNVILIHRISKRLGVNTYMGLFAGMVFLFATPAYPYAVTLYQHHFSTFLILLSVYILTKQNSFSAWAGILFIISVSFLIDYPNIILMFPFLLYIAVRLAELPFREIGWKKTARGIALLLAAPILPALMLMYFNNASYGNPFQLSGTVKTVKDIKIMAQGANYHDENVLVTELDRELLKNKRGGGYEKTASGFFREENFVNGIYILLASPDRGLLYYAPVVALGVFGIMHAIRKKMQLADLLVMLVGANVLIYSLWGDPWGGWAFGARYLIPSYAVLSIFFGLFLTRVRRRNFVWFVSLSLFLYGIIVNTAGAVTSNSNPPFIEVEALEKATGMKQAYTWERNFGYLRSDFSKSFFYNAAGRHIASSWQYYGFVLAVIAGGASVLLLRYRKASLLMGRKKKPLPVEFGRGFKKMLLNLKLFMQTPREFLYLYAYSPRKRVRIKPYNPKALRVGRRVVKRIEKMHPDLSVHFIGSAVLHLPGQNDVDLYVPVAPYDIPRYLPGFIKLFGTPDKSRKRFAEWHVRVDGVRVDLLLVDPLLDMFYKPMSTHETLVRHPRLLKQYRDMKTSLNNVPIREYQKQRLLFFNKVLGIG